MSRTLMVSAFAASGLLTSGYDIDQQFVTTGDGYKIAYRLDGPAGKPVLVLSNSIATNLHMWDGEIEKLTKHFRVLRFDTRGHGASDVPPGPYSVERMGHDVIELLDALKIDRVHFLGLSLGGFIGQWVAVHHPERIDKLVLANTSSYVGGGGEWSKMIDDLYRNKDMKGYADMFMKNWFPADMIKNKKDIVDGFRNMVLTTKPEGLAGAFAAVRDADLRRTIALIKNPTLVIGGKFDTVTLPEHSEQIAATIPGAKLVILPAVHMTNVEMTGPFLQATLDFLLDS